MLVEVTLQIQTPQEFEMVKSMLDAMLITRAAKGIKLPDQVMHAPNMAIVTEEASAAAPSLIDRLKKSTMAADLEQIAADAAKAPEPMDDTTFANAVKAIVQRVGIVKVRMVLADLKIRRVNDIPPFKRDAFLAVFE